MFAAIQMLKQIKNDGRAVTAVEYALIAGVMAGALGTVFAVLTGKLSTFFGGLTF
jgi:Flp pilus assembly pilin Flp